MNRNAEIFTVLYLLKNTGCEMCFLNIYLYHFLLIKKMFMNLVNCQPQN